jgi:hypothetical protein
MQLQFVHRLPATPDKVYSKVMDPDVIRRCIDGCESLTPVGENTFETVIRLGGAKVKGRVQLLAAVPGESMTLVVEGKAFAGSVKASVKVRLAGQGVETDVHGDSEVTVGGLAAALGPKLLEDGARKAIADFYSRLAAELKASAS